MTLKDKVGKTALALPGYEPIRKLLWVPGARSCSYKVRRAAKVN